MSKSRRFSNKTNYKKYFESKVYNYLQDVKAGRLTRTEQLNKWADGFDYVYDYDEHKYVNVEWLNNCINKHCGGCGNKLTLDVDDKFNVSSDITAQRLDNNLLHYIDNIIPMCVSCNCSNK